MGSRNNSNARRSRKRTFGDVFGHSIDEMVAEEAKGDSDGEDEDDDLAHLEHLEKRDAITSLVKPARKRKKAKLERMDTPAVGNQLYFDPIRSHNAHCPFVRLHQYQREELKGFVYALRLLPRDVMYIKGILERNKAKE